MRPLRRDPTLSPRVLAVPRASPLPPPLASRQAYYFEYARAGLWHALRLLGAAPGDNVLLPSYICDVVLHPVVDLGLEPRFVRVREDLGYDLDHLASRIDGRSRAILLVHYFGLPHPDTRAILDLASRANIPVVEDCAHALLGCTPGGEPLGTLGCASIISLRKTVPMPGGAALVVNDPALLEIARETSVLAAPEERAASRFPLRPLLGLFASHLETVHRIPLEPARWAARLLRGAWRSRSRRRAPPGAEPAAPSTDIPFEEARSPMNGWSMRILRASPWSEIFSARRSNYERLFGAIESRARARARVRLVGGPLPPGACPLVLPLVVHESPRSLERSLLAEGIEAYGWPFLPPGLPREEFPEAHHLAEHLLALPIHQGASPAHLRRIAEIVAG